MDEPKNDSDFLETKQDSVQESQAHEPDENGPSDRSATGGFNQQTAPQAPQSEDPVSESRKVKQEVASGTSLPPLSRGRDEPIKGNQPSEPRATGPRTPQGKKSRFNALKHGLFSRSVLLDGEAICGKYETLLRDLRDYWQPHGTPETLEIELQASSWWRFCRCIKVESAEISKKILFAESDFIAKRHEEAFECSRSGTGLMKHINNLLVVHEAMWLFVFLRDDLTENGFQQNCPILMRLYGQLEDGGVPLGLRMLYEMCGKNARLAEERGDKERDAHLRSVFVEQIDAEIKRLTASAKELEGFDRERVRCMLDAAFLPDPGVSDALMRVRTQAIRDIERSTIRLERLQRMRKGQPLPPQVDVNISS
jgi:hypothetical protein